MKKQITKNLLSKTILKVLAWEMAHLSGKNPKAKEITEGLADGFSLRFEIAPLALGINSAVKKTGGILKVCKEEKDFDMTITFKSVSAAFPVLTGKVSVAKAYAQSRFVLKGDYTVAIRVIDIINIAVEKLLPKFMRKGKKREYFEFSVKAETYTGEGSFGEAESIIKKLGLKKPLLVSDAVVSNLGFLDALKDDYPLFCDVPRDSSLETVKSLYEFYQENGCDGIFAVGGGSVLDSAKGLKLALLGGTPEIKSLMGIDCVPPSDKIKFIAVPTTAATGSEATKVCVIKDGAAGMKLEFVTAEILPDVCILDPELLATLPQKSIITGAFDALCHAVEAYHSVQKNPLSDFYALSAITKIKENLESAVQKDTGALGNLLIASNHAGIAFSNSMVGLIHAIAHSLGAVAGLPHDLAVALTLPEGMAYNGYTQPISAQEVGDAYIAFADKFGLPKSLGEAGVKKEALAEVAKKAVLDGAMLTNPRPAYYDDIIGILERML